MAFRIQRSTQSVVMLRLLCISTPPAPSRAPPFRRPRGYSCRSHLCRLFSFPHGRIPPGCRRGKPSTFYVLCCGVHCPKHTPLAPVNASRATFAAAGACAADSISVRYSKWCRIWGPAAVCMASGRFAWIRASLLLEVASSAPSHIADDHTADDQ